MLYTISFNFIIFILYSILGYFVEVIYSGIETKKISFNRGFLIGPYIPIFGVGAVLITIFLTRYKEDVLILFIVGTVVCAVLEYITSYIMEKIFKLRWWDYSNYKYNINGRVCLETAALFGIGGLLVVEVFNPFLLEKIGLINDNIIIIIGTILIIIFLIDLFITLFIMFRIKININKYINKDATEKVKTEVIKSLKNYIYLVTRILNAFPNIQYIIDSKKIKKFPGYKIIINNRFKAFEKLMFKIKKDSRKKRK